MRENFIIVKKAGFVDLSKVVNLLGLLVVTIILARYFTRSEFASYDQFWLIFNTIFPVASFAFTSSIYFFGSKENAGDYITEIFWFLLFVGLMVTFFLFLLSSEIAKFIKNPRFAQDFPAFAIFSLFSFPSIVLDAILILKNEFKTLFKVTTLTIVGYAFAVVLTILYKMSVDFIFICLSVIALFRFVYTWSLIRKFWNVNLKGGNNLFPHIKEILLFTSPLIVGHIGALVSKQVDKYIVANNFPSEVYAIYTIGARELPIVSLITSSFASVVFPEISRLYANGRGLDVAHLIRDVVRTTSMFIIPTFSFLLFFAEEFVVILFSEKYVESTPIFRIYLLFLPVRVLVYSSVLSALGKQKIYMLISLFDLAFNLSLGVILVKVVGLIGPAIAVVSSTFVEALLMLLYISKVLGGIGLSNILPFRFMSALWISSLILSVLCYLVSSLIHGLILKFILPAVLFSVIYLFLVVRFLRKI